MSSLSTTFDEAQNAEPGILNFWARVCEARMREAIHVKQIWPSSHWKSGGSMLSFRERGKDYAINRVTRSSHSFNLHIPLSFGIAVLAHHDFQRIATKDEYLNFTEENIPVLDAFYHGPYDPNDTKRLRKLLCVSNRLYPSL